MDPEIDHLPEECFCEHLHAEGDLEVTEDTCHRWRQKGSAMAITCYDRQPSANTAFN